MDHTECGVGRITYESLGEDKLLSIAEVADILGVCHVTASKVMSESGHAIRLHRRLFILESSLLNYLREQEGKEAIA